MLAIAQSNIASKVLVSFILHGADVKYEDIDGSIFRELSITHIEYEGLKADELTINLTPHIYDDGVIRVNYIALLGTKIDTKWLDEQLNAKGEGLPEWFKGLEIRHVKLGLKDFAYSEFIITKIVLDVKNLKTDLNKASFDFAVNGKTNIVDIDAKGNFKDNNYTASGFVWGVDKGYVDTQADDVDFKFVALKKTPFSLSGDLDRLNAIVDIENSDIFYKFDIDAKIIKAHAVMDMNLSNTHFNIQVAGRLASKFAILDSDFNVTYNGKTRYYGYAKPVEILYVPLGVFKSNVKIVNPQITKAFFDGNVSALRVEATANSNAIITDDEPVVIEKADVVVDYIYKPKDLKVVTQGFLKTDYGNLDTNVTVTQKNNKYVEYTGNVIAPKITNIVPKDYSATATFNGNDTNLNVLAKSDDGSTISVNSNGYKQFNFFAKNHKLDLQDFFDLPSKYKNSFANIEVSGIYDNTKKQWNIDGKIIDGTILKKKISANNIKLAIFNNKTISLEPTKIVVGKTELMMQASQNANNEFNASLKANSAYANFSGALKPIDLKIDADIPNISNAKKEFGEFLDLEKEQISGNIKASAHFYKEQNTTSYTIKAKSNNLSIAGIDTANLDLDILKDKNGLWIKQLNALIFNRNFSATSKEPLQFFNNGQYNIGELSVNNGQVLVTGSGNKIDKKADINLISKNFTFFDPRFGKGDVSGNLHASIFGNKLEVTGALGARDVEVLYKVPSISIPHDRDIIVIKNPQSQFASSWFRENCFIDVNVSTLNRAKYRMKDGNITIALKGKATKEYEKRLGFSGILNVDGNYSAVGKTFKINKGNIFVKYGDEENPMVNLELEYKNPQDNITIYVFVTGNEKAPNITFASNPIMNERDMLSYLAFGVNASQTFSKQGTGAQDSAQAIAMLSTFLSRNILGELGAKINTVNVSQSDYQVGSSKIEVGASLTKDVSIIYQQDINSRVGIKYNITPKVGVQMTSGQNGSSAELTFSQDY